MMSIRILPLVVVVLLAARTVSADPGILLLAHGGSGEWNARVMELAAKVNQRRPTEVAFGMATRATMQSGIDRLVERGATEIVAVPLFVSSWSTVITSTEYLLGLRAEAPAALAIFAKMNHGAAGGHDAHAGHAPAVDGTTPVKSPVPIRMTPALNDHPIVADVLASRARAISRNAAQEAVIIVAHGPTEEDDNTRWLADMASLAARVGKAQAFASVDYLTLRDDAPKPIRDAATRELRGIVERALSAKRDRAAVDFVRRHRERTARASGRPCLHDGRCRAHAGRSSRGLGARRVGAALSAPARAWPSATRRIRHPGRAVPRRQSTAV
jgi:hypothetical protein